jgi:tetratricopeptide (TPR) repeat protein
VFLNRAVCVCGMLLAAMTLPAIGHEDPTDRVAELSSRIDRLPLDEDLYLQRSELHFISGRLDQAARDLDRALALGADLAVVRRLRGRLLLNMGRPLDALRCLRDLPVDPEVLLLRGRALRALDRLP